MTVYYFDMYVIYDIFYDLILMIFEVCLEEQALANIFSCEKDWKEYNHLVVFFLSIKEQLIYAVIITLGF